MKHEELKELLPLYVDGGLDKDEKELVKMHLDSCKECQNEVEIYKKNYDFLSSVEAVALPDNFLSSVLKKIEKERRDKLGESTLLNRIRELLKFKLSVPVSVVGVVTVMVLLVVMAGLFPDIQYQKETPEMPKYDLRGEIRYFKPEAMKTPLKMGQPEMSLTAKKAPSQDQIERKIIKKASLQIEVKDIKEVDNVIIEIVENYGGFISGSRSWISEVNRYYSWYELRIPTDQFYQVISRVEELGKVLSRSIRGEDVTEEYIDLETRLKNLKLQEERYRQLLIKAVKVDDILKIERELERVRSTIESLQGKLNYYDDKVSLSTIDVEFREPEPITSSQWGIVKALKQAVREMTNTFYNLIVRLGALLPYLVLILIGYVIFRVKRLKR
ncbi:hypothetical protein BBF96_10560 [Anoxybacter fermentans]|uniref:Anti-sigma-W factor RsiW n=1 Tax=Anoxybacter fermentans TaxID=1323375 RepID=A0A3S9SZP6_9FIRM|nr:DUF4349 domain-containing protein [Anoxybacter fermentans]AZR73788.1 hypothetical protein BBF96_10560 [Anoxybacter fermentans]